MIARLNRIVANLKAQREAERQPEKRVVVYDTALSARQIDEIYQAAVERTNPTVVSWDRTVSCGHVIPRGQRVYFADNGAVLCRACMLGDD